MAMAVDNGGRGGRRGRRERSRPMSEINVTPMVDVMLVLLVVFMVTAPLLTVGVQVDLPKTKAGLIQDQVEPLAVTVSASGQIFLQDKEIELSVLAPRLIAITGANPDVRIFVRGDKAIEYGRVMQVMGTLNAAGFRKVALITEMPQSGANKTSRKKSRKKTQSNSGKK
ncbi:MAG: protein TolR [Rhodospirillaceae bacterium]|jgi:biopolymer transport protein TolR|nr:protein TolR [Rhodospirillaceae bacterium]